MRHTNDIDIAELDKIIIGRVEPYIYAFSTKTVPNYLKVGDTYRPLDVRLEEWRRHFPNLEKQFADVAKADGETYFRDYAIHSFLEREGRKQRLERDTFPSLVYYSNEFFKDTKVQDVEEAIIDIKESLARNDGKYRFYRFDESRLPIEHTYPRNESYEPRPNQKEAIANFRNATANGRTNLLMYAVMRFGKSFTSMCCAAEMKAKVVVIVSAKADVKEEWKKTVESHIRFNDYEFLDSNKLRNNHTVIAETLGRKKSVAVFLSLQDLQGKDVKTRHKELFRTKADLLIVDETHFGARGEKYGEVLQDTGIKEKNGKQKTDPKEKDTFYLDDLSKGIKVLKSKVRLHLSGTPYRILMGDEFRPEDIVALCQFTDIVKEQEKWNEEHLDKDDANEWDNPYYGFPQMVRFAFHPNKSTRRKLEELRQSGITYAFSALFKPKSIKKDEEHERHKVFQHEREIQDLLEIIDGTKSEDGMLCFLDYDKIKEGEMCRHIVCVLPFRASCDALEELIARNKGRFKNLGQYEIVNIAGIDGGKRYKNAMAVKERIKSCERSGRKTLTLTVNRMLTGSTVEEWDTMLYFKDTASPQEYDQAIFRLQNQYIKKYTAEDGKVIKRNMKPQTMLVDFDPNRMFAMQEQKSQIYNVNTDRNGNKQLEERIREELRISPIVTINRDKIERVKPANILDAVREYSKDKSVVDEATAIPIDLSLLDIDKIRAEIGRQAEIDSKQGFKLAPAEGEGTDLATPDGKSDNQTATDTSATTPSIGDSTMEDGFRKRFATYYSRILFFAFLTKDPIISLQELIDRIDINDDNRRIAINMGLDTSILKLIDRHINRLTLRTLDYKIHNINTLANDGKLQPMERVAVAMKKFSRLSSSEVVTPEGIADKMIDTLGDHKIGGKTRMLDIASKQGEFVYSVYRKLGKEVAGNFYSIPTSTAAYEFTRKVYELLDLDVSHIEDKSNSYDLKKGDKPMKRGNKIEINGRDIRFDAIVSNPPYQEEGTNTRKKPIYPLFYDVAFGLSSKAVLITPGRFLFRAGYADKAWMERMLTDRHLKVVSYFKKSSEVFPSVEIKGGVAITIRDTARDLGPVGFFTEYPELASILQKVASHKGFRKGAFAETISAQGLYKFTATLFRHFPIVREVQGKGTGAKITSNAMEKLPEVFLADKPGDGGEYIRMVGRSGNRRVVRWMRRAYVRHTDTLECYKVLVPAANGTGTIGETLSAPIIGAPAVGHTDTFLSVGKFNSEAHAQACLKYIKTKFARTMLGTLKATQQSLRDTWTNVPMQDFTDMSDIDWSQPVAGIDRQLYGKYNLDDEERRFIEEKIKPM